MSKSSNLKGQIAELEVTLARDLLTTFKAGNMPMLEEKLEDNLEAAKTKLRRTKKYEVAIG